LLRATQAPKKALGEFYVSRWNVELNLRKLNTTLGMERFHYRTPR